MNGWRKSSHSFSNGNCAEVAAWRKSSASKESNCAEVGAWRKSSRSADSGDCAEVGQDGTVMRVRDTTDQDGPVLAFPAGAWMTFLTVVRSG